MSSRCPELALYLTMKASLTRTAARPSRCDDAAAGVRVVMWHAGQAVAGGGRRWGEAEERLRRLRRDWEPLASASLSLSAKSKACAMKGHATSGSSLSVSQRSVCGSSCTGTSVVG